MNSWEITKDAYREQDPIFLKAEATLAAARAALGGGRWGEARRFAGKSAGLRLERVDKAHTRWSQAWERADKRHRDGVERALRKGLPVPDAVLADYPDLVQGPDISGFERK